jgi:hypothetical protein
MWVLMKHFGDQFVLNKEAPFTDIYPTDRGRTGEQKSPEPEPENWEHA